MHGKDTVALMIKEELERNGKRVLIAHYADLLKYMCKMFFGWNGEKDDAGRELLQRVGTDIVRGKHDSSYWVRSLIGMVKMFDGEWDYVLIPDARFPDESVHLGHNYHVDSIHLRIVRKGFKSPLSKEQQEHESETALDTCTPDLLIINDGTLEELKSKVEQLVERGFFDE